MEQCRSRALSTCTRSLASTLAEATEVRAAAQRLKVKVTACEKEHKPLPTVVGGSGHDRMERWGAGHVKQMQGMQARGGGSGGADGAGKQQLHLTCSAMDRGSIRVVCSHECETNITAATEAGNSTTLCGRRA